MYKGFNLKLTDEFDLFSNKFTHFYNIGLQLFENQKKQIETNLAKFLLPNNSLDGSAIKDNWFPEIESDIFISHSHLDQKKAIALAGWFFDKLKLKSFIDSTVWGYSNELLYLIDDRYCRNSKNNTFSYIKRNFSTSHVYLMLATALNKMIDNCECIFFLNTPNSISSNSTIEKKTTSPWIYTEIELTRTIQKRTPKRNSNNLILEERSRKLFNEDTLKIEYDVIFPHLYEIKSRKLSIMETLFNSNEGLNALDILYYYSECIRKK